MCTSVVAIPRAPGGVGPSYCLRAVSAGSQYLYIKLFVGVWLGGLGGWLANGRRVGARSEQLCNLVYGVDLADELPVDDPDECELEVGRKLRGPLLRQSQRQAAIWNSVEF